MDRVRQALFSLLQRHAADPAHDLRQLFAQDGPARARDFAIDLGPLYVDLSKQALTRSLIEAAGALADELGLRQAYADLRQGVRVNASEDRAALHTLLRTPGAAPVAESLRDHHAEVLATQKAKARIAEELTQLGIDTIVHLGIGGSDLGPRLGYEALSAHRLPGRRARFAANVDGAALSSVLDGLDPARTAFVLASKSFTTQETLLNADSAQRWMAEAGLDRSAIAARLVAVTSKPEAAVAYGVPVARVLPMGEWVGGRYSIWSAVGFTLLFCCGAQVFREFLDGAHAMDEHTAQAPWRENLPFLLALVDLLQRNGHGRGSHAVLVYDERLARLPEYLQQLEMESNGKTQRPDGLAVSWGTAPVIWGGIGTTAQHAFFQSLHQGTDVVPVSFVAAARAAHDLPGHHEALLANLAAQGAALLRGRSLDEALAQETPPLDARKRERATQRVFSGNRPSSTFLLREVSAEALGMLLAAFEHKVYFSACCWGINPFDQWGVELGKEMCRELLPALSRGGGVLPETVDASTAALIGKIRDWR